MYAKMREFLRKYKFNSLMFMNFLKFFLVQLAVFIVIVAAVAGIVNKNSREKIRQFNSNEALRIKDVSETAFSQIDNVASNLVVDQDVKYYVSISERIIRRSDTDKLLSKLIYYKNIVKYINSIYVYSNVRDVYCTTYGEVKGSEFTDREVISGVFDDKMGDTYISQRKIGGVYPMVISLVKKIDGVGCIVVNVDYDSYKSQIKRVADYSTSVYPLDSDGNIVFENPDEIDESMLHSIISGGENNVYTNSEKKISASLISIKYFGQRIIVKSDWKDYSGRSNIIWIIVLMLIVFSIISVIIAVFSAFASVSTIVRLHDVFDNKTVDVSKIRENEEKYIVSKIIEYIDDNNQLRKELDIRLAEYNRSQIMALQKQINPHFLNNVLSAISYEILCDSGKDSPALTMIIKLTRILEYSFMYDKIMVSLSEELDFVDAYVDLLRERFGNFGYECRVQNDLYSRKILRLTIQPLVENAVYHGIHDYREKGKIKLEIFEEDKNMIISVSDNGVGISTEKLAEINEELQKNGVNSGKHIGMRNVYKRIVSIYGAAAEMKVESEKGVYTRVYIKLPPAE